LADVREGEHGKGRGEFVLDDHLELHAVELPLRPVRRRHRLRQPPPLRDQLRVGVPLEFARKRAFGEEVLERQAQTGAFKTQGRPRFREVLGILLIPDFHLGVN
jgi:hypothetical protein